MVLGEMWIGSLDLHEAFAADGLVAAPRFVQVWRIGEEADGAFRRIFVQEYLESLAVDKGIFRKFEFLGTKVRRRSIARVTSEGGSNGLRSTARLECRALGMTARRRRRARPTTV
jgi:hypothetical protein